MRIGVAIFLGIVLGILFAHAVFLGGFITLGVWAVAGLVIGVSAKNKKEALINGGVFGFVVSFAFLIADYGGSVSIVYRLFPFALLSLVGLVGGLVLGIGGSFLKNLFYKREK